MGRFIWSIILAFVCSLHTDAQQTDFQLKFGPDREFKIMQICDCLNASGTLENSTSELLGWLAEIEKPNLIVFTFSADLEKYAKDAEVRLGNFCKDVPKLYVANTGSSSLALPVKSSTSDEVASVVYVFNESPSFEQTSWYRQQSKKFAKQNSGLGASSIAFVAVPLSEYEEAFKEYGAQKTQKKLISHTGTKNHSISCPNVNYGLFTSMHECGDISGVFCGYDKDNDFALVWKNIMLANGRVSKNGSTLQPGARIITLKEGEGSFMTYIRDANNEVADKCTYPNDFPVAK